jgi:hypothetical protein
VQIAWRMEYYGLAALMAVAWDSQLSPVDNRSLTLAQVRGDAVGPFFALAGTKTGTAAAATLTPWSQAILIAYLKKFGADLLDTAPLFWTRDGRPISRRGDTGQWAAITAAAGIFSRGRTPKIPSTRISARARAHLGEIEDRQLQDMRRSGAVEGDAGGGSVEDQSNKMANTINRNNKLRKAYNPVNVVSARRFDEARVKGGQAFGTESDRKHSVDALGNTFAEAETR